ncbi:MAG: branched-chain-amino-acid transaminase [Chthoniobacterales bacterium]|nr:branched-chain-amino-acid transaminase [Chthoniobacterales bacterium]MCX7713245.1 branched-chain-amino-acid transaminase [Chthoniobacterales bacterium]
MKIYLDGNFCDKETAKISVFDHGLLYGDGVFEGIRFYNGRVFKLDEHLRRLQNSAKAIALDLPMPLNEIREATLETIRQNKLSDGYVRLVVTRGCGDLGLSPLLCPRPSIFIIASTITLYPPEKYENGLEVVTCSTRRISHGAISPMVKSLNYLNNVLAKLEAIRAGAGEGLLLNEQGYVAECTGDNIFYVHDNQIFTPPTSSGALAGITRATVIQLAQEAGYTVNEPLTTRYDLYTADECFLTGTAAEVIPVVRLDGRPIGTGSPGPITRDLMHRFHHLTMSSGTPIYL